MSKVVITGLSMTSCLGLTLAENWNSICGRLCGLSPFASNLVSLAGKLPEQAIPEYCNSFIQVLTM